METDAYGQVWRRPFWVRVVSVVGFPVAVLTVVPAAVFPGTVTILQALLGVCLSYVFVLTAASWIRVGTDGVTYRNLRVHGLQWAEIEDCEARFMWLRVRTRDGRVHRLWGWPKRDYSFALRPSREGSTALVNAIRTRVADVGRG